MIENWDVLIRDEANNSKVQQEYIDFLRALFKGIASTRYIAYKEIKNTVSSQ